MVKCHSADLRRPPAFPVSSNYGLGSQSPLSNTSSTLENALLATAVMKTVFCAGKLFFSSVLERITITSAVRKIIRAFADLLRAFVNPFRFRVSSFPTLN